MSIEAIDLGGRIIKYTSCVLRGLLFVLAWAVLAAPMAFGQAGGTTAPLTGIVSDATGGILPGAGVLVKNNATGAEFHAVTDGQYKYLGDWWLKGRMDEYGIQQSIIALFGMSSTSPTGRYIAPASSSDCVQVYPGQCAPLNHFVRGPWIPSFDMAFVKRFPIGEKMRIEARMDLYNVFNTINFNPVTGLGSTMSGWKVTSAWTDMNASQFAGGRMTQFGLRFSW